MRDYELTLDVDDRLDGKYLQVHLYRDGAYQCEASINLKKLVVEEKDDQEAPDPI